MQSQLFEYAIAYIPKETRDAQGNDTTPKGELIKDATRILAKSDKEVAIIAAREVPEKYLDKVDEVQIKVRPF